MSSDHQEPITQLGGMGQQDLELIGHLVCLKLKVPGSVRGPVLENTVEKMGVGLYVGRRRETNTEGGCIANELLTQHTRRN